MIHEDDRRILESWPEAKVIEAKTNCVLGMHYHQIKTEKFVLLNGDAMFMQNGWPIEMEIGRMYTVHPNQRHAFHMKEGSVMIGICSHPYDPTDDYK